MDNEIESNLKRFRRYRESVIHSDTAEFEHHLKEFVRELKRNSLAQAVIPHDSDSFEPEAWWAEQRSGPRGYLSSLNFPDSDEDRILALLDLAESMASSDRDKLSVDGFGRTFRKSKREDSVSLAINLVIRPLAEILSDRIREHVGVVNPAIRELAGVPLNRIPPEGETKIFLSHKTVDKPLVEPYHTLLSQLGLSPWLDTHDMKIGDVPHRGIATGFDQACAVIFFLTENFRDERWLAHEIDQAIQRKIDKGDRFSIITLLFGDADIPRALSTYIYHPVKNDILAIREVIRALPIELGPPRWRT